MSAFILSDKHISTIALLIIEPKHQQEMANKLKAINIASVNYRYNENTRRNKCKMVSIDDTLNITMDDLYNLVQCWIYQACENDSLEFKIMKGYLESRLARCGFPVGYQSKSTLWSI